MAQGEKRLGRVERPLAGRRADRAAHLDRKATSISLLVVLGVRQDGQKVLLAIKQMGGESTEAWRTVLDDLIKRGLRRHRENNREFFWILDGFSQFSSQIMERIQWLTSKFPTQFYRDFF